MLKTFSSEKINITKNVIFFLLRTHYNFTFYSQFLHELEHKVHLSKSVCRISYFRFCLVFIKVHISVQQKAWNLLF